MSDCFNDDYILVDGVHGAIIPDADLIQALEFPMERLRHDVGKMFFKPRDLFHDPPGDDLIDPFEILQGVGAPFNGCHTFWRSLKAA